MSLLKRTTPSTEKQRAASRANGAKSRGPATPRGKRNSSANSRVYPDYFAAVDLLSPEELQDFAEYFAELIAYFQPRNTPELLSVRTVARARTWLYHYWRLETAAIDAALPCPGFLDVLSRREIAWSLRAAHAAGALANRHSQLQAAFKINSAERTRQIVESKTMSSEKEPKPNPPNPLHAATEPAQTGNSIANQLTRNASGTY